MKLTLIICVLAAIAIIFNLKLLGGLVGLFLIFCALFGIGDFIHDCCDGHGFSVRGQMRRQREGKSWIKL